MLTEIGVIGFLGAGKTMLAARISSVVPDIRVQEFGSLTVPSVPTPLVAAVDAVNLAEQLDTPEMANLVRAQIRAAAAVVLMKTDVVAAEKVRGLFDAGPVPVLTLDDDLTALATLEQTPSSPAALDVSGGFSVWRYEGGAELAEAEVTKFAKARPPGLYRLTGVLRIRGGGLSVERVGRSHVLTPIDSPAESRLVATGPKPAFQTRQIEAAFAMAVAESTASRGLFSYR